MPHARLTIPAFLLAGLLAAPTLPALLHAQTIAGRVVALPERTPAPAVTAVLVDSSIHIVTSARTADDGVFALEAPGPGQYQVVIYGAGGVSYVAGLFSLAASDYVEREFLLPKVPEAQAELYLKAQVDSEARPSQNVRMVRYPDEARARGVRGLVSVLFVVDTTGRVERESFELLAASDSAFAKAVRDVVPSWRFRPALRAGRPVRQLIQRTIDFGFSDDPPRGDLIIRARGVEQRVSTP